MVRVLLSRRWLTALLVAVLFFLACLSLGRWQFGRWEDRRASATLVETYYEAEPVPLADVLGAEAERLPDDQVWRRVETTGRYDVAGQQMVRNRPQSAPDEFDVLPVAVAYGFEVLVPLELAEGDAVLVDRGWVPNAERADVVPDTPPPPDGEVSVVGWLRQGEASLDRDMPAGQLASIDIDEAAARTGHALRPAYLVLDSETTPAGGTPERPQPLVPPTTDTGPHLAYAIQWWGASVLGFVLVFVFVRREWRDGLDPDDPRVVKKQERVKKLRVWDEEDG